MAHYPNPFDFVPFPEKPFVQTETAFLASGELWSGYLELTLTALTPVHVVGSQSSSGGGGRYSRIHRQVGLACIPAASIRGCLRAFIEALTAGWVSQATPVYEKVFRERQLGFATFGEHESQGRTRTFKSRGAINSAFKPAISAVGDPTLDVASFLFGVVFEPEGEAEAAHESLARKSRVWVEDAVIQEVLLEGQRYWLPDLDTDALMGGPKPSASSWWYMKPRQFWKRDVRTPRGNLPVAEFVGDTYRGRKFYYHQAPERCLPYYDPSSSDTVLDVPRWKYDPRRPFCKVGLECLKPQGTSDVFRIYVDRVPKPLLALLVLALMPGQHIRHKIGYGKAYGYGTVAFSLVRAMLRPDSLAAGVPAELTDRTQEWRESLGLAWNAEALRTAGVDPQLVDWKALAKLAQILYWSENSRLVFTYPPFAAGYFGTAVSLRDFEERLGPINRVGAGGKVDSRAIARNLAEVKATIHFLEYQETAIGWDTIANRTP